jgi:hypothetical protein
LHAEVWLNAGTPATEVVDGGAQGPVGKGTQGAGENTPNFAAVAAWTAGLAGDEHSPKGLRLVVGTMSVTTASGATGGSTDGAAVAGCVGEGSTVSGVGVAPKLHLTIAPLATSRGIASTLDR